MGKKQHDDVIKGKQADDIPDLNQVMKDLKDAHVEIDKIRSEQSLLDNQLKRAVADYQNLEKRVEQGRSDINSWAVTDLLSRIAGVMHYFDQAFKGVSEDEQKSGWFKGVQMATMQLKQVLKDQGLEEIEAGGEFDPGLHEAVDTREGEDGKILEIIEKGYKLNGKILKPARVIVGKKGEIS